MPTSNDRAPLGSALWKTAAILAAAGGLLLVPLDNSYRALWFGEAQDSCHVPLFFVLTLLLAYAWPGRQLTAVAGAMVLSATTEIVQPLTGRSASWQDLVYGLIGVTLAVLWMARSWRWPLRLVLATLLLAWPTWRVGPSLFDAAWAWRSFPELAVSGSPFERRRWYLHDVQMQRLDSAVEFRFVANQEHGSGAILLPVVRDWTGYQTLEVSFEFDGPPLLFLISVRDGKKLPPELPRFDLWRRYPPGRHDVRIDLNELARGGSFPPIELDRVQSLHLVAYSDRPQSVIVHRLSLAIPKR